VTRASTFPPRTATSSSTRRRTSPLYASWVVGDPASKIRSVLDRSCSTTSGSKSSQSTSAAATARPKHAPGALFITSSLIPTDKKVPPARILGTPWFLCLLSIPGCF
jgi:hypothetical protein